MTIFYDKDRNYAEVFFKKTPNYGEETSETLTVFKSEKGDKVVGYGFDNASKTLFETDLVSPSVKLAILLKMVRAQLNLTQAQAAKKIGDITLRHYQRLEAGEENPTLDTIEHVMHAYPKTDFSRILKHANKSSVA